jgi:C4-dicarboxylate-specific signal transduction histidine kinase
MPLQRFDLPDEDGNLEERYWSVVNVPIADDDGNVRWIVHRIRDMTQSVRERESAESQQRLAQEQEELIETLRAANRELIDRGRRIGDTEKLARLDTVALMTSAIAHDLSQPLVSATNFLGAFRRHVCDGRPELPVDLIDKAEAQIKRAGEIVRNLRSFIAGEASTRRAESVQEMVRRAAAHCEVDFRLRKTEAVLRVPDDLPRVLADRTQIEQVLVNVMRNAVEAMKDQAERRLVVSAVAESGFVRIDVADSGPGFGPEEAANLFRPFQATGSKGLGLGLAICREIVQAHSGTIAAKPNLPHGAVISIGLPVAP